MAAKHYVDLSSSDDDESCSSSSYSSDESCESSDISDSDISDSDISDSESCDSESSDSECSVSSIDTRKRKGKSGGKKTSKKAKKDEVDNRKEYELTGVFHEGLFARLDRAKDPIELVRDNKDQQTFKHAGVTYYIDPLVLGQSVTDIRRWLQVADYYKDFKVKAVTNSRN